MSGFGGTAEIMLAMERREVDALENPGIRWCARSGSGSTTKKINVLIQAVLERGKELPDTPTLVELGYTPEDKAALAFYTSAAGEPFADRHARHPGGPSEGVARRVPGDDARPAFLAETRSRSPSSIPRRANILRISPRR